jgi:hypothetical protein
MKNLASLLVLAVVSGASTAGYCDEALLTFGGDQFSAGQVTTIAAAVEHDAFALGNDVTLSGTVAGDAHLAGYDVDVSGAVVGDLYAAGFSVNATASVGGDLNAAANVVTITSTASVGGNARLAAATVTLAAPVSGAALITAKSLTLNAPVSGDFSFYGENLTFGPNARVDGQLHIRAPREIAVPSSVAAADRVQFQLLEEPDYVGEAGKSATGVVARFWPVFWTMAAWWLLLVLVGAAFIALLPRAVTAMQVASERHPFRKLGLGFLAFAAVLGLVPALALTVVGILLIPFILIFVVVACSLAYLAGAFFIGMRIASAFVATDTNLKRLGVLAVALIAAALGGMIPVVGWLITLVVVIFGFGTATTVTMVRWSRPEVASLGSSAQPAQ